MAEITDASKTKETTAEGNKSSETAGRYSIMKLYVTNLPEKTNKRTLQNVFSKYGTVESVHPVKKGNTTLYAFVTYSDAKYALKAREAALNEEIKIDKKILRVEQAHTDTSQKKSKAKKSNVKKLKILPSVDDSPSTSGVSSNYAAIHLLDDDCLHKIFMELSFSMRMSIERVCKRWQRVSEQAWPDVKQIKLEQSKLWRAELYYDDKIANFEGLTNRAVEKVLIRCGRFLNRLEFIPEIHNYCLDLLPILTEHCYNVTDLILSMALYPKKELDQLFTVCKKLKYLQMNNLGKDFTGEYLKKISKDTINEIHLIAKITDSDGFNSVYRYLSRHAVERIRKLPNLHTLKLNGFSFKSDKFKPITENKSLRTLSLACCAIKNSIHHLGNLVDLEFLDLQKVVELNNRQLASIVSKCTKIKSLNITHCVTVTDDGIAEIAKLPSIEHLNISELYDITDLHLGKMVTLKKLQCNNSDGINDQGIIKLIEKAPNLELLTLLNTAVSGAILETANEVTRRRTNDIVLKIQVNSSVMDEYDDDDDDRSPLLIIEEKDDSLWDNYYDPEEDIDEDDYYDQEDDDFYGDDYDLDDLEFDHVRNFI